MPMSITWSAPARLAPGATSRPILQAPKVTVRSARTAAPGTRPVLASTPLGTSTATIVPGASFASRASEAYGSPRAPPPPPPALAPRGSGRGLWSPGGGGEASAPRGAPPPPMPTSPSTIRSADSTARTAASGNAAGASPGSGAPSATTLPPAARSAASPAWWTRDEARIASTRAPRRASRAPANSASPPLSPPPASTATREPYTRPRVRAQTAASAAAARCMSVPSGSLAMSTRSAARIWSAVYAVRTVRKSSPPGPRRAECRRCGPPFRPPRSHRRSRPRRRG